MVSRRRFIGGSVAGLVPVLAAPARAAPNIAQKLTYGSVSRWDDVYNGEDGLGPTVVDPLISPYFSADASLLLSKVDESMAFSRVKPEEIAQTQTELPGAFAAIRCLGGYAAGGDRRMTGVMDVSSANDSGAVVKARIAETPEQYQISVTEASRNGLEPVWVQVDNVDRAPRFHTLYRRKAGAWEARHNVKPGDMTDLTTGMTAKGMRLARMAPYYSGGVLQFAVLFRPSRNLGWEARFGLDAPDGMDAGLRSRGYSLLQATRYLDGSSMKWACIWQNQTGVKPNLFWGV